MSEIHPTRLYIKKHQKTGLMYFGMTRKKDVVKYNGSGVRWKSHLKKHGSHLVETVWVSDYFYDRKELEEFSIFFSEFFDITKSNQWANLRPENGIDGNPPGVGKMDLGIRFWKNGLEAAVKANTGKKRPQHSKLMKEYCEKNRELVLSKIKRGHEHHMYGRTHSEAAKKNISEKSKSRVRISCIKCHKPSLGLSKGIWACHFFNHHRNCNG